MAVTMPAELRPGFNLLGVPWPDEDEDVLRRCAAAYRGCGDALSGEVNPGAKGAVAYASAGNSGEHVDALNGYMAEYDDGGTAPKGHLQGLAASMHALADGLDLVARLIEIVKAALILLAIYVMVALAWALAMAVLSGGLAMLKARTFVGILRVFARRFVAVLRQKLERYFRGRLVRAVEARVRRMLGAKPPALPKVPKRRLRFPTAPTMLAAAGGVLYKEGPKRHDPAPESPRGVPWSGQYRIGPVQPPEMAYDHDFPYDPDLKPTLEDYRNWYEWRAKMHGARIKRPDLEDGLDAYERYMSGSGRDHQVNYEKAYDEDDGVRRSVDDAIANAQAEAERLYRESGRNRFEMTGLPTKGDTTTENWDKAIGAHAIWGSGNVTVQGNQATMQITLHAEDRYNFNAGAADKATGIPDDENGRFEVLGWAKSFNTHGSLTRTVTWTLPSK
ncbi:WXG100-like domain-containing protein [Nonomuraea recticatena]|uniref:Outer membrane channel protein CpnT-like N-terminal domain-containing protein n=1 Tax=Nonomuraea recticatena TaxID=46178 RepID=A0ABN3R6G5_9ACTN